MVLRYLEAMRLTRGHSSGVSALAFSPGGTYLASAGLDGKACIWNPSDGRLLHVFSNAVPILTLTWDSPGEDTVICGLQDGTIVSLAIDEDHLSVTGFWAHSYPVECLATSNGLLASGAHEEVRVWKRMDAAWVKESELQGPPKTSVNRLLQVVVTSLHWLPADSQDHALLVVTYLNHGYSNTRTNVGVSDALTASLTDTQSISADASISRDAKHIAISNVISGFDVYSIDSGQDVCSFGHTVGEHRKIPVLFIHDGRALVGGNVQGDVHLWDVQSGRKLHSLLHQNDDQILALAAHYDPALDTFLIATGVLAGSSESIIHVWETEELGMYRKIYIGSIFILTHMIV
ncbi:WD40-repeat-containing domain protein [Cubamyces menziesii]|nr:WD40-repeat-containing domain protein [Cubamyces menziesii]